MADLPYVHLPDGEGNGCNAPEGVSVSTSSATLWPSDLDGLDVHASDPEFLRFDPSLASQHLAFESYSDVNVDFCDRESQVNFVMDLFHQRVEHSSVEDSEVSLSPSLDQPVSQFALTDDDGDDGDMDLSNLELGLGLLANDRCQFMAADPGNEFFVTSRSSVSEYGESSSDCDGGGIFGERLAEFLLHSEEEEEEEEEEDDEEIDLNLESDDNGLYDNADVDTSLRLCWDSFQLEDHRDANVDSEWEEVDGRLEDREVMNELSYADGDEEDFNTSVMGLIPSRLETDAERVGALTHLDWEVLLNVQNLESNTDLEHDNEPQIGDYVYTDDEYDILFSQFVDNDNSMLGKPPASRAVIENLPSVVLTKLDEDNNNASCAVCKDEMIIGMQAKQLPCSHRYHGDCIIPWLAIRNTCPVCRHELLTDDLDYERRKMQRLANIH